jgi:hypothetical protein
VDDVAARGAGVGKTSQKIRSLRTESGEIPGCGFVERRGHDVEQDLDKSLGDNHNMRDYGLQERTKRGGLLR